MTAFKVSLQCALTLSTGKNTALFLTTIILISVMKGRLMWSVSRRISKRKFSIWLELTGFKTKGTRLMVWPEFVTTIWV